MSASVSAPSPRCPQDDPEGLVADREVTTTKDGQFLFGGVPASRYHICLTGGPKYLPDYSLRFYEVRAGEAVRDVVKRKVTLNAGVIDGRLVDERGQGVTGARLTKVRTWLQDGIPSVARTQDAVSGGDGHFAFSANEGNWAIVASTVSRFVPQDSVANDPSSPTSAPWNGFVEMLNEPLARNRTLAAQSLVDGLSAFPPSQPDRPIEFFSLGPGQSRRNLQVQLGPVSAYRISGRLVGRDVTGQESAAGPGARGPAAGAAVDAGSRVPDRCHRAIRVPSRAGGALSDPRGYFAASRAVPARSAARDRCDLQCVDRFSPTGGWMHP